MKVAHDPGLAAFDHANYVECSRHRTARVLKYLDKYAGRDARILDYGAWLGNVANELRSKGYWVETADFYEQGLPGGPAWRFSDLEHAGTFDVVLMMGVIEHIPHTPRLVLDSIQELLPDEGLLIVDMPNLAYVGNRRKLARGESPYFPIQEQFLSEIPFEGHHREYTGAELCWMLTFMGHEVLEVEYFNYAKYLTEWPAKLGNALSLAEMWLDPTKKELVMTVSRKTK